MSSGGQSLDFQHHGKNKKRKSGSISRLKKFGAQGKLGRGYEIDSETYNYFVRVLQLCNQNQFDTPEEKDIFVDNSFTQTENEEVHLSSNQLTSRVLEILIGLTKNEEILLRFTTAFTPSLRTICTDPFASHVLEKLLEVISEKWTNSKKLSNWFRSTAKYVYNNFEEFVFDKYANPIMRKVCQCLTGTVDLFSSKTQSFNASSSRLPLPLVIKPKQEAKPDLNETAEETEAKTKCWKKNRKILKEFATRFLGWPQFYDLFQNEITSGLVQCLILTLRGTYDDLAYQGVIQTMKAFPDDDINLESPCQLHSLEVCITISSENEETFNLLFNKYFKGKLLNLASHTNGHFTFERLFLAVPTKETFDTMFEKIEDSFQEIYAGGYLSVFTSIADGCKRLQSKQSVFVQKLALLLGVETRDENEEKKSLKQRGVKDESTNFFQVLAKFGKTFKPKEDGTITFLTDIQGCYVLQYLLDFHKPFKVMASLLELDGLQISKLAMDPKGSHVIDTLFASATVGDKNKEKVIQKLKEHLVTMACTKFGARVLDNLFSICTQKQKATIAAALGPREAQLNANSFGKFLATKYGVHLYKVDPREWAQYMGEGKKRKDAVNQLAAELGLDLDTSLKNPNKKLKVESSEHE